MYWYTNMADDIMYTPHDVSGNVVYMCEGF